MTFTKKYSIEKRRDEIQLTSIDNITRVELWSMLHIYVFDKYLTENTMRNFTRDSDLYIIIARLWMYVFSIPIDEIPSDFRNCLVALKNSFFELEWNKVYDIIDEIIIHLPDAYDKNNLIDALNNVLEQNKCGYRILSNEITKITNELEMKEIEMAITADSIAQSHLRKALKYYSDRKKPDYLNSIKESISAVESILKCTVGSANDIENAIRRLSIHRSLGKGILALYGYASNEQGVRHGMTQVSNVSENEARFLLIICSSIVNFINNLPINSQTE